MEIMDGKKISSELKLELKKEIDKIDIKPLLVVIQIGNDEASNVYIKNKEKDASEIGISFKLYKFDEDNSEQEIIALISKLNNDDEVSGIILQLPIPSKFNKELIINQINPKKDVDGLTDSNKYFIPCTAKGIIYMLDYYNVDVMGKHVVLVGRSNLVGKPLINLFLDKDATVTICHSKTVNLKEITKMTDILVVAVGKKDLITKDMVKDNAIIIDVGINRVNDKLYGDVDYDNIKDIVSYITPVPGGVGPMTRVMLLSNVLEAYKKTR